MVWGCKRGADRSFRTGRRLVLSTILACAATTASAQLAPQLRPPTREQVTRPTEPTPRTRPRLEVEGGIERAPCALEGPDYKDIHLKVAGADFEGLQGLSSTDLVPAYAPFVGRDMPISVVCEIRDRAATIIRKAGYIAAVQVPEQKINGGMVRFDPRPYAPIFKPFCRNGSFPLSEGINAGK